jgi:hypothetical protein
MSNAKWIVFGFCFLAIMIGLGVWWVECKIAQVTSALSTPMEVVTAVEQGARETAWVALDAVEDSPPGQAWLSLVNGTRGLIGWEPLKSNR